GVLLVAVAHLEELLRRQVGGQLAGEQVVLEGDRDRLAVLVREHAGVDGVLGLAVGLFIGGEEVDAVLDDGAAEGGAVLLALVGRLVVAGLLLGLRLGVELLVAEEAPAAAREVVGAGLGDDGQHAAGGAAVLGLVLLRLDVELLDALQVEVL